MSEEEYMEECERRYIEQHTTHIKGYTEEYVKDLQQKIEQLEKDKSYANWYAVKKEKEVEQLENIRKEAIELIKKYQRKDEFLNLNEWQTRNLLNILNKGSDK